MKLRIFAGALIAAVGLSSHAEATYPGENGRIAFTRDTDSGRDFKSAIFSMRPNGSGVRRLTPGSASSSCPAWSPDGSAIAFNRYEEGVEHDLWIMSADGSDLRPIPAAGSYANCPTWSPSGSRIAYSGYPGVQVVAADGRSAAEIVARSDNNFSSSPVWSPGGGRIAFVYDSGEYRSRPDIALVRPRGGRIEQVTNTYSGVEFFPSWHPSGDRLFHRLRGSQNLDVTRVTSRPFVDGETRAAFRGYTYMPTFSPDGKWIVFAESDRPRAVFKARADGSKKRRIATLPSDAFSFDWQPR